MAEEIRFGGIALKTTIHGFEVVLQRSWDLKHGRGWFVHCSDDHFRIGFGFHKTNRFTAVRQALADAYKR